MIVNFYVNLARAMVVSCCLNTNLDVAVKVFCRCN